MTLHQLPVDTKPALTLADCQHLPPTLDGHQTAEILGCSYWMLLELVKAGRAPVEPLRLGRRLRWPTIAVLAVVGIQQTRGGP